MPVRPAVEPLEGRNLPAAAFQTLPVLPFADPAVVGHSRAILTTLSGLGVVPVLSTIPDIAYAAGTYRDEVSAFNQVVADVAGAYRVPLWNLWRALAALPGEGLDAGGVHLDASPGGGGGFH